MNSLKKLPILKTRNILTLFGIVAISSSLIFSSCGLSRTAKGGLIGAAGGGVIGGLLGHKSGNTVVGVLIGATIGGTAGALIGRHMDKQAEKLQKDLEGATVQRMGEGILITFDKGMQFGVNKSSVPSSGTANLNDLARILKEYDDTDILIEGHTDNTGEDAYNQTLSEKRAESVRNYLISQGVASSRITSKGYGENQPLQDNDSEAGRAANRRVEVAIYANKKMQRMAKNGEL